MGLFDVLLRDEPAGLAPRSFDTDDRRSSPVALTRASSRARVSA